MPVEQPEKLKVQAHTQVEEQVVGAAVSLSPVLESEVRSDLLQEKHTEKEVRAI